MKQQDDNLTIDLYAAPRRNTGTDIQIALEHHKPTTSNNVAISENMPTLAVTDENPNARLARISENTLSLAIDLGVDASVATLDMIKEAAHDLANAATLLVRTGVRLAIAKANCAHGEFEQYCSQVGIAPRRAQEAMSYADLAARLEPKERERYLLLPKKSALLLANAEPALVEFLLEDGNEEIAKRLRKKSELTELARELTETTDALNRHAKENEALHKELRALKEAQLGAIAGSEYPMQVVQLRKESAVLADDAIAALSSIRQHAETFETFCMLGTAQDERNLHAAMWPTLNNVASVLKAADDLLRDLCLQYGMEPSDIAGRSNYALPSQELAIIDAARQTMLARKNGKAAARHGNYIKDGDLTRGRGRPSKS